MHIQNKWNISSMFHDIYVFCMITAIWLGSRSLKSAYLKNAIWCNLKKSLT